MLSSGWKGPLRCVVHFVEANSGTFRYRVLPVGARLRTPGEGTSLAEWADRQAWARSTEAGYVLPTGRAGTAPHLPVRVGPWPVHRFTDAEQEAAAARKTRAETILQSRDAEMLTERYAQRLRDQEAEAERVLTKTEERVDPKSVVPGPDGLKTILKSGRFRVSGTVSFRPLQPFEPSPKFPSEEDRFVAFEEVEYVHM
jgi:hypothetical protein